MILILFVIIVLILVLVEDGFRAWQLDYKFKGKEVLILVLVEDGFRVGAAELSAILRGVLILVLLDVPLGLSNKVSTSKDKQDMSCSCEIMAGVLCFLRAQKSTNLSRGDFTHFVK